MSILLIVKISSCKFKTKAQRYIHRFSFNFSKIKQVINIFQLDVQYKVINDRKHYKILSKIPLKLIDRLRYDIQPLQCDAKLAIGCML